MLQCCESSRASARVHPRDVCLLGSRELDGSRTMTSAVWAQPGIPFSFLQEALDPLRRCHGLPRPTPSRPTPWRLN